MIPEFVAIGYFEITGRGLCISVQNPGGYPEPNVLTGTLIRIDGTTYKVRGVETFAIGRPYPESLSFAFLVGPDDLADRLRKRADQLKPIWATASDYWYDNGGRRQRDDADLLREAADRLSS